MAVTTQLPLREAPGPPQPPIIPCYFFPVGISPSRCRLQKSVALALRTYIDDFDAAWMNTHPTPIRVKPWQSADRLGYVLDTAAVAAVRRCRHSRAFQRRFRRTLVAGDNLVCVKSVPAGRRELGYYVRLRSWVAVINSFPSAGPRLSISQSGGNCDDLVERRWDAL